MNFQDWKQNYIAEKKKILADESLNGFQKENAIRALSGIEPVSIAEYNERVELGKI